MNLSRRDFVASLGAASIGASLLRHVRPYPLGLKPGVQLWSVGAELSRDVPGTLRELARIGFRELEIFELPKSPRDFRRQCDDLGLSLVSGHFYLQSLADHKTIEVAQLLGLEYIIVVFPTLVSIKDRDISNASVRELTPLYERITLDDYRWNAEQFNRIGEQLAREGLQLGYHNHAIDLKPLEGTRGLDELIARTDPGRVVFEMDTGHVIHAGRDPIAYLEKYPTRIQLLHLKDLKAGYGISARLDTEELDTNAVLGVGVIDWRRFFTVAARGNIRHWFIEHEGEMGLRHMTAVERSLHYLERFS